MKRATDRVLQVRRNSKKGFTLLELLAVLVIIGIIAVIAVPMMRSPGKALQLKSSADILKSEILLARQEAITLNGTMEMRFYQKASGIPFTAYQVYAVDGDGNRQAKSKLRTLPDGIIMPAEAAICPLLTESAIKGVQEGGVPAVEGWPYSAILVGPSGGFEKTDPEKAYVTLIEEKAPIVANDLPANYAVVMVQTTTGMVTVTQP